MKKAIITTLLFLAIVPTAKSQFYNTGSGLRSGRINVFGGIHNSLVGNTTFYGGITHTDYYGNHWNDYIEVEPSSLTYSNNLCLGYDFSLLNDANERVMMGATIGIFGTKSKMHATFDLTSLGKSYATDIDAEINQIDVHIGIAGLIYVVPEKVSIDFSLSPGFLVSYGDQVRYINTPPIPTDMENNTWRKAENAGDLGFPNIDVMLLTRVGVSYHITERMWVGALFQYRQPVVSMGSKNTLEEITMTVNDDFRYVERKHKGYALMLTWGIDIG